jgi:hypothetical protein
MLVVKVVGVVNVKMVFKTYVVTALLPRSNYYNFYNPFN